MNVRENFEVPQQIINLLKKRKFKQGKYSVTKLLYCPRKTYFKMTGVEEVILDIQQLIFARGHTLHSILEVHAQKEIPCIKDSEVLRNGIPILISGDIDMRGNRITEIFTTSLSSNRVQLPTDAIDVFKIKVRQLMAYCNFEDELEGDLLVFFLFGNYSKFTEIAGKNYYTGVRPELRCFTFNFKQSDLDEVWKLINLNLAEIELAKKTGIPPLIIGEDYECKGCGFEYVCFAEEEKKG